MQEHEARTKILELRDRYTTDPAFKKLLQKDPMAALKQAGIAESDISPEVLASTKNKVDLGPQTDSTFILCTYALLTCCCIRTSCCIVYGGGGGAFGGGGQIR